MSIFGIRGLVVLCGVMICSPVLSDEASVKCVQEELNGLGYDAGSADGKMGGKSRSAAEKYAAFMAEKTPGWAMEPLSNDSAALWCEKVAEAWPDVAHFFQPLQSQSASAGATVFFDLSITGPSDVVVALTLLKGDAVTFQAEGKSGEPKISFGVPASTVAASDRFCVVADPRVVHFEDQAGGKFQATCDALPGDALPDGSRIGYATELHEGGTQ